MTRTFLRAAELEVARPAISTRTGKFGFFEIQPNGIKINAGAASGLRVTFSITKTLEANPNDAEIIVYNLSEATRAAFQQTPMRCRLQAGYETGVSTLFVGDIRHCEHRKTSVEWETRLSLGDGERAYRFGHVNRSFRAGVTRKTAASEAAAALGLTLPAGLDQALSGQFASGLSLFGPAHKELSRVLEPAGLDWSIQDGQMQVLAAAEVRRGTAIRVAPPGGDISAAVLVGVPEYGTPRKKGDPPTMSCNILLNPEIVPGTKIVMDSAAIKGAFKVVRVVHSGDTAGGQWYSACEARPL